MSVTCSSGFRAVCQSLRVLGRVCSRGNFHSLQDQSVHRLATAANLLKEDIETFHTDTNLDKQEESKLTMSRNITTSSPARKPEPPQYCCMNGCPNCVWIEYAADLTNYYKDGGQAALDEIEKIEDPTLKMIVKMQLDAS